MGNKVLRVMAGLRILHLAAACILIAASAHANLDPPHDTSTGTSCLSCHDFTSPEPKLIPQLGDTFIDNIDDTVFNNLCWNCHDGGVTPRPKTHSSLAVGNSYGDWTVECWVCHNQHKQEQNNAYGTSYGKYVRTEIDLANIKGADGNTFIDQNGAAKFGKKTTVFRGNTGPDSFADGDSIYDGVCELCHTVTSHFRSDGTGSDQLHYTDSNGTPAKIGPGIDCAMCHKHVNGFAAVMPSHSADPGSDYVMVFEEGTHDDVMVGDGMVYAECRMCHNTHLSDAHDYQCLACHPSPAETVVGTWGGGCQQGGCHAVIHADVSAAHNAVDDDCNKCHGPGWWPTSAACPNCHAVYSASDSIPPATTSNAKASYTGPARIEYSVRDGGKVVVAQTYSRVDGGSEIMGSSILVSEPGSHTLEFWSVDQANNIESPPNVASFDIIADTNPPVTISNAKPSYYQNAYISLSASDDSDLGVKTTYYSLDGGAAQTGALVYVPGSSGTFDHSLDFWSEDWSGNVEEVNTAAFSITAGTGTFRMWDGGSSCLQEAGQDAWIIEDYHTRNVLAWGTSGCDVVFPVGTRTYYVWVEWWNGDASSGYWDEYVYGTFNLSTHGQVIELN